MAVQSSQDLLSSALCFTEPATEWPQVCFKRTHKLQFYQYTECGQSVRLQKRLRLSSLCQCWLVCCQFHTFEDRNNFQTRFLLKSIQLLVKFLHVCLLRMCWVKFDSECLIAELQVLGPLSWKSESTSTVHTWQSSLKSCSIWPHLAVILPFPCHLHLKN